MNLIKSLRAAYKKRFGKRYTIVKRDGMNVLVETESSKAKSDKWWAKVNVWLSLISAAAAVVAAIFAALTYINT